MGDPRVCGGLNGGESGWPCLGLSRPVVAGLGLPWLLRACECACNARAVLVPGSTRAVAWLDVGDLCLRLDAGVWSAGCRVCPLRGRCSLSAVALRWRCDVGRDALLLDPWIFVFAI